MDGQTNLDVYLKRTIREWMINTVGALGRGKKEGKREVRLREEVRELGNNSKS